MYLNIGQGNALGLGNVGGFANFYYWSSTQYDYSIAWDQDFILGIQGIGYKDSNDSYVSAVRDF